MHGTKIGRIICGAAASLLLCLALSGCEKQELEARYSVLIYLAGDNSLSYYGRDCFDQLRAGYIPSSDKYGDILMVFYHIAGGVPTLSRFYKDSHDNLREEVIASFSEDLASGTTEVFSRVLEDAERAYPAKRHGLVLWSHATGFLPAGYYNDPQEINYSRSELPPVDPYAEYVREPIDCQVRSFAMDSRDNEMEIGDLASALVEHYDFILTDCCLMGGVEVAYELKDKCDYIVFSPTEIMAKGFPYETMMDYVFNGGDTEQAMVKIASDYYEYYEAQQGTNRSATVSVVRTAALESLAAVCREIFSEHRSQITSVNTNRVQQYFRFNKHWFYDLGDFVSCLATTSQYERFEAALDDVLAYKNATQKFISIVINKYSGLSTYIPNPGYTYLNNYYRHLAWNKAAGLVE